MKNQLEKNNPHGHISRSDSTSSYKKSLGTKPIISKGLKLINKLLYK